MAPAACSVGGIETVAEIVLPSLDSKYATKDQQASPRRVEHIEGFFDCGPREVHPWQRPAMPSHEKLQQSANYPVLVTGNPVAREQVRVVARQREDGVCVAHSKKKTAES